MTSNNSNNVNNANGGESGNSADGAIEGVAIEAAANVTGSEQRQAAVNDAAVADGSVTNGSAGGWGVDRFRGWSGRWWPGCGRQRRYRRVCGESCGWSGRCRMGCRDRGCWMRNRRIRLGWV